MASGLQAAISRKIGAAFLKEAADDLERTEGEADQSAIVEWLRERAEGLEANGGVPSR